jgi:site-specific DNA-adenine methylase
MKAPFPYFGNKARVAPRVWEMLGDPALYIEPFAGALGVYLNRPANTNPDFQRTEVLGDFSALITNIWRALKYQPARTALHACNIVSMLDYHATHKQLMFYDKGALAEKMRLDPLYCDPEAAGLYIWLLSCAIGGHPEIENNPRGIAFKGAAGQGVNAITLGEMPHQSAAGKGDYEPPFYMLNRAFLCEETGGFVGIKFWRVWGYFQTFQERLENTDIVCGDFITETLRFLTHSQLRRRTTCGIFLDPPYNLSGNYLYGDIDVGSIHARLVDFCIHAREIFETRKHDGEYSCHGKSDVSDLRIVISCHEGEYDELLKHGWHTERGITINGYTRISKDKSKTKGKGVEALYYNDGAAAVLEALHKQREREAVPLFA